MLITKSQCRTKEKVCRTSRRHLLQTGVALELLVATIAAAVPTACADTDPDVNAATSEIVGGSPAPNALGVLRITGCTAALIHPKYVLTAGHCIGRNNDLGFSSIGVSVYDANNIDIRDVTASSQHTFGHLGDSSSPVAFDTEPAGEGLSSDVALLSLRQNITSAFAPTMEIATQLPAFGSTSTMFGFGCTVRDDLSTSGVRRSATFVSGTDNQRACKGDSGGPAVHGGADGFLIWGVTSYTENGNDRFGHAVFYQDKIVRLIQAWEHTTFEAGIDRGGNDFEIIDLAADDPALCRRECQGRTACRAFTHVRAGVYGPQARCFLKDAIPGWRACSVCTSGTILSEETDSDRFGNDYTSFFLPEPRPELCRAACARDSVCASYAYVEPNYTGAGEGPKCYLKSASGTPNPNGGTVSGMRRGFEVGYDRYGNDLSNFTTSSSDPSVCSTACAQNFRCQAFTFVPPGIQEGNGHCYLKYAWGNPIPSSGLITAPKRGLEMATNRPGGDFKNFDLSIGIPEACQAACANDPSCQSFTFSPAGWASQGSPHCWLKSSIPPAVSNADTEALVSGIKGNEFF
jgi:hypothetical protein